MLQLLQCVSVDVITRGQLGRCTAVRAGEVISLLQKAGMANPSITKEAVEADMLSSDKCRRSQQKFLHHRSNTAELTNAVLGVGGNRCIERCIIIQQSEIQSTLIQTIREGTLTCLATVIGA